MIKRRKNESGVALIIALGVLALLAILGTSFLMATRLEYRIASNYKSDVESELIARAGFEHAMAVLRFDRYGRDEDLGNEIGETNQDYRDDNDVNIHILDDPVDSYQDPWKLQFWYEGADPEVNIDIYDVTSDLFTLPHEFDDATWITVHGQDKHGTARGRYAVLIEDELSKININTSSSASYFLEDEEYILKTMPYGIKLDDLLLLPEFGISKVDAERIADRIVEYRWGVDGSPGEASEDDNANGIPDSFDEGCAFSYLMPFEGDQVFKTLDQVKMLDDGWAIDTNVLRHFLTCYSEGHSSSQYMGVDPNIERYRYSPIVQKPRIYLNGTLYPEELFNIFVEAGLDDPAGFSMNLMAFIDPDRCAPLDCSMNRTLESGDVPVWGFRPWIDSPHVWSQSEWEQGWKHPDGLRREQYIRLPSWARQEPPFNVDAEDASVYERCWAALWFEEGLSDQSRYYGVEGPRLAEVMPYGALRLDVQHADDIAGVWNRSKLHEINDYLHDNEPFITYENPPAGPFDWMDDFSTVNEVYWCIDDVDVIGGDPKTMTFTWEDVPKGGYNVKVHSLGPGFDIDETCYRGKGTMKVKIETGSGVPYEDLLVLGSVTFTNVVIPGPNDNWIKLTVEISNPVGPQVIPPAIPPDPDCEYPAKYNYFCVVDYIELESHCQYVKIVNASSEIDLKDWYVTFGEPYTSGIGVETMQIDNGSLNFGNHLVVCADETNPLGFKEAFSDDVIGQKDPPISLPSSLTVGPTAFEVSPFVPTNHLKVDSAFDIRLYDNYGRMVDKMRPPTMAVAKKDRKDGLVEVTLIPSIFPLLSESDLIDSQNPHALLRLAVNQMERRKWQHATMRICIDGTMYRVWERDANWGLGVNIDGLPVFKLAHEDGMEISNDDYNAIVSMENVGTGERPSIAQIMFERQAMERVDPGLDHCPHNVQPILFTNSDGNDGGWKVALDDPRGGRPGQDHPCKDMEIVRVASEYPDPRDPSPMLDPAGEGGVPHKPWGHLGQLKDVPLGYVDAPEGSDKWVNSDAAQQRTAGGLKANLGANDSLWLSRVMDAFTCVAYRIDVEQAIYNSSLPNGDSMVRCTRTPAGEGSTDNGIPKEEDGTPVDKPVQCFRFEGLRIPAGNYILQLHVVPDGKDKEYSGFDGPEVCGLSLGVVGSLDKGHGKWGELEEYNPYDEYIFYSPNLDKLQENLVTRFYCYDGTTARGNKIGAKGFRDGADTWYDMDYKWTNKFIDKTGTLIEDEEIWKEPVFYVDEQGLLEIYVEASESGMKLAEVILAPLCIPGKINVNTASEVVLTAALKSACDYANASGNTARDLAQIMISRRQENIPGNQLSINPFGRRYCRNGEFWSEDKVKSPHIGIKKSPSIGIGELLDIYYAYYGNDLDTIYNLFGYSAERFTVQSDVFRITVIGQSWRGVQVDENKRLQLLDPKNDKLLGEKRITSVIRR